MKGEVSLKKLGGQKRGGTWQRVRGYGKVGLPQDTRPGVSRLCSETNRGLHLLPSVLSRVYWALNRAQLSLPFHPPPSSTSRGEVCNVFDLMHSRNKVYCRVACVASWIHFSWASAPPHVRVFARAPLCAHRKTWLGLMKRARWLPPLFLSLSLSLLCSVRRVMEIGKARFWICIETDDDRWPGRWQDSAWIRAIVRATLDSLSLAAARCRE